MYSSQPYQIYAPSIEDSAAKAASIEDSAAKAAGGIQTAHRVGRVFPLVRASRADDARIL